MRSKYEVFIPTVRWLHSQQKTDTEIAECVGIDSRRVGDLRRKIGLKRNNPSEIPLRVTEIQNQVLIGGIIGDMCIFKDKNAAYHRMNLAHSLKQRNYLLYKASLLGDLFSEPTERTWMDDRTNNTYHEIRIQSRTHEYFTGLYKKWYRNGKKIIHEDIWKMNDLGLAILYYDDGCRESTGYAIALNDYSPEDIHKVAEVLEKKFNLSCTVPKNMDHVYIKAENTEKFREIITKHMTVGLEHKL